MKWITLIAMCLAFSSLSAQQFSLGIGGLYQFKGDYVQIVEDRKNSVRQLGSGDNDSTYALTLLTTIRETQHVFKAKPGWQVEGNFDWNFAGDFSLATGIGLRSRSWEYDAIPKKLTFYEDFIDTLAQSEIPDYEPSLVCDSIINRTGAQSPSDLANLTVLDIIIPLGINYKFSENFDMGLHVLVNLPISTLIENEFTDTDFYEQDGEQFCENFLAVHEDTTGDFFNSVRWSSELKFTYWIKNIGLQAVLQTTTTPLMKPLPDTGPDVGQVVTSDTFKPRFIGLIVNYKFGK